MTPGQWFAVYNAWLSYLIGVGVVALPVFMVACVVYIVTTIRKEMER